MSVYPTLDRPKSMHSDEKKVIEKNIGAIWNKREMSIDTISDPLITFVVRVISHKFFQFSQMNNVSCITVNLGYKIVKRDHFYDLAKF